MATKLRRTHGELRRGMALGWHSGTQLYTSLRGQTVADVAIGEARPGVPMTTTTIDEWASATKAVPCGALALLWQRGLLDLDDPVCRHLPEFAANGTAVVTVRHLLTHTAGLIDPLPTPRPIHRWRRWCASAACSGPSSPASRRAKARSASTTTNCAAGGAGSTT